MRWWALALLCSCGRLDFDPIDASSAFTSGTRLKIVWTQFEDGTRSQRDLYDSMFDQRCAIGPWSDGNTYCTPFDASVGYLDAACTMPIVVVPNNPCATAGPAATHAASGHYTGNIFIYDHLYEGTSEIAATPYYYLDGSATCIGTASNSAARYFASTETSPAALTRVSATIEATTGRYALRLWESDDGFRQPASLYDSTLAAACTPGSGLFLADTICAPSMANDSTFTDASCSDHVVMWQNAPAPAPPIARFFDENTCMAHYVALGAPTTAPAQLFTQGINGSTIECDSLPIVGNDAFFLPGPEVAMPSGERSVDAVAGHRLQHIDRVFDGARFQDSFVHDTALDLDCGGSFISDDEYRCVPFAQGVVVPLRYYSDAACTQPINVIPFTDPPCGPGLPPFARSTNGTGTCGNAGTFYSLTPSAYQGPLYYLPIAMPCEPVTGPAYRVDLGPPLDPSIFAAASTVIDP